MSEFKPDIHNGADAAGRPAIPPGDFDAFVFDLDGVVTRTARVHAAAWKTMFDDFLAQRTGAGERLVAFDIRSDYPRYVDGKPRYDGVRSFLESRNITLPFGNPGDAPGKPTVCGLGNLKDELFHARLLSDGVEVYETSVDLLRRLRDAGIATAVVSSSRNCVDVLESAGIAGLFDERIDGLELERLNMAGKPAADMFLEASRRLNCPPERCVGIEDATAGVQAAKAAGFGYVVGVNRADQAQALYDHGADVVVADLGELRLPCAHHPGATGNRSLPEAGERIEQIVPADGRLPALFLDYDGTLTPIVSRPEQAILAEATRTTLRKLAGICPVAIISGRDLADVRIHVGLPNLWYAGSHGFDIAGPGGERSAYKASKNCLSSLDAAERDLQQALKAMPGCLVERKRFSIAVHYRLVESGKVDSVKRTVEEVHHRQAGLRLKHGKKVIELQPDVDWDKGKAMRWLMQVAKLATSQFIPIYIGDDVTDEDAFRELVTEGVGIIVAKQPGPTLAKYRLDDPDAVTDFLNQVANKLIGQES